MQRTEKNMMHLISYCSRKTSKTESKCHSYELEALVIMCLLLERFREYLIGVYFVIKTYCNSFNILVEEGDTNPPIVRWSMKLLEFNFTIECVKGENHLILDG